VPGGEWRSGYEAATTNQRMELHAVLDAVRSLDGVLDVVTDSTYVANCFRDRWYLGWQRKGWRNSKGQPVANRDLWEPLIDAFVAGRFGVPRWVKGHSGDVMNDRVDALAVRACQTGAGESGRTGS
jgi:ribonuclease HI